METILVKIFATALALSQVTTAPDAVKTQFDRERDQEHVAQLLHAGCTHMRKAFDIEDINFEELIAFALLLYTGQRRSDVVRMGRQHTRGGTIEVKQVKTGREVWIPIHETLATVIAETPRQQPRLPGHRPGQALQRGWLRQLVPGPGQGGGPAGTDR
jgi:integrase